MARRLRILDEYADLCSLMERWVIHQMKSVTGGLGYPRKSLDFSYIQSPASSIDPTGYSAEDHRNLEASLDKLGMMDEDLFAVIKMHYMPWTIKALVAEGHIGPPNKLFFDDLIRAHRWLKEEMNGRSRRNTGGFTESQAHYESRP